MNQKSNQFSILVTYIMTESFNMSFSANAETTFPTDSSNLYSIPANFLRFLSLMYLKASTISFGACKGEYVFAE